MWSLVTNESPFYQHRIKKENKSQKILKLTVKNYLKNNGYFFQKIVATNSQPFNFL